MAKQEKMRKKAAKLSHPSPVELPSGKWRCQVMVQGHRLSVVDDDPEVAHAKVLAMKNGLLEESRTPTSITVGEAIDRYIRSKDSVLSPSTVRSYKSMRQQVFGEIENNRLYILTQEQVQRWANSISKGHAPKYVANAHGLLSAAISVYRPDMVLRTTLPQKRKTEIAIPSIEEVRFLEAKAKGTRFELPFLLATWMGLRTSEIRGLTWDCVSGNMLHVKQALVEGEDGPVLKATKSYSGNRKLRIPPYIRELIEKQPHTDNYIIHYSRNALYNHLRLMCNRHGLPHYRFHDLRHVQASVMLLLNVPDKYAMERMGHSSTHMLKNVYQHTMKEKRDEVADTVDRYFEAELHTDLHT